MFKLKNKYWNVLLVAILSFMLVVTGCSQSKPSAQGGGAGTEAKNGDPIKVGVILSFSGSFAPISESIKNGMELYFGSIGKKVGNHPIEIKYEDDEANPQVALRKYRSLIGSEKANILVGPVSSTVLYALRDQVEKDKVILIDANAAADGLSWDQKSDYVYRTSTSNWQNGMVSAEYLAKNVGKKAVTIALDYPAGKEIISSFSTAFKAAGGTIVKEMYSKIGTSDFGAYLTQMKEEKPDFVFAFLSGADGIAFTKQYKQFGLKGVIPLAGSQEHGDSLITDAVGEPAEGSIAGAMYSPSLDNPVNKKFIEEYNKKYNSMPNMFSVFGYDSAQVIAKAFSKADSMKPEDLMKVLKGIEIESPRGPIKIDPKTNNPIQNYYIVKNEWKDGKIVQKVLETVKDVTMPEKNPNPAPAKQ